MNKDNNIILEVRNLDVKFFQDIGTVNAVNGATFQLPEGKSIGIVGESGCGKTITAYSTIGLLPPGGKITNGEILYTQRDGSVVDTAQLRKDGKEIRSIRGRDISMIFQEPMTALSPVHTI
ncbi:MAG: ATP-binding cassette domain-containing protein, partial [Limnochordia bacterium]